MARTLMTSALATPLGTRHSLLAILLNHLSKVFTMLKHVCVWHVLCSQNWKHLINMCCQDASKNQLKYLLYRTTYHHGQ
jgi:hypothetical protein